LALGGVRDGFAGGVVVVAEVFSAEAWAAAAGAVDEDVAALVAFRFGCVVHCVPPHGVLVLGKVLGRLELGLDLLFAVYRFSSQWFSLFPCLPVKYGGPTFGRAFFVFLYYFYFTKLEQTKLPLLVKIFFGEQVVSFVLFIEDLPRAC
jgi:hypothetical protein